MKPMNARRLASVVPVVLVLAVIGCGPGDLDKREHAMYGAEMDAASAPAPPMPGAFRQDGEESARAMGPTASPRQLIRTGQMTVRVEQVEPAVERLQELAVELGGFVGDVSVHTGAEQLRQATIHLRVPAARLDDAIAAVRPLGTVEAVNVSAQDVTEQHADLEARLANARRLEQRLLDLLATRTGDLQQVLAAERELSRVRTEIELYDGRLRQLADRVEMSTLTVHVREPRPIVGRPGESVIGDAFRQAWRNFVWTIARIIAVSGVLIPVLALVAAVLIPTAIWVRRRRVRP
jgi:hypothetical protein